VVSERLQVAGPTLPPGAGTPLLAPMSSIMGEIMFLGLLAERDSVSPMLLRDVAELPIRRRLLGIPGVAQVMPIGGELRQVQVILDPSAMRRLNVGHRQILAALEGASTNAPGGFYVSGHQEYLIRGLGRPRTLDELGLVSVGRRDGSPVLLRQVAAIRYGPALARGTAAIDGRAAVVLAVQKQPQANTLELSAKIDAALDALAPSLPEGVRLYRKGFRQARFIETALGNVSRHIAESAALVLVVITLFLMSWRTTLISLTALPLSLLTGVLCLEWLGGSINTMTLGGFAISIGALVDDAIIDVENVHRRLRQRAALPPGSRPSLAEAVFSASSEIRSSIVYATAVIVIVFLPLFFLSGMEGRLLRPLGLAYVVSLAASLLVAVTVTPALCTLLLRDVPPPEARPESRLVRLLRRGYAPALDLALRRPVFVLALSLAGVAAGVSLLASFGRGFLPRFNEGSFTIAAATAAGTPLRASDQLAGRLDRALLGLDFVTSVVRRTGRAELDEHAQDVQFSEIEITVDSSRVGLAEAERRLREAGAVPGLVVSVGQPIGHRIEHMLSGVKTALAIKIYGDDLPILRGLAQRTKQAIASVPGVVDLQLEPQTDTPQLLVRPRFASLAQVGLTPRELTEFVETAFQGHVAGQYWEGQRTLDLLVRYPDAHRRDLAALGHTPIDAAGQTFTSLLQVARLDQRLGPNLINRENVQRRIVVMANVAGRDIRGVVADVRDRIERGVRLPRGTFIEYGGEFESEARATRTIVLLSLLALLAIAALLWAAFRSARDAALVLASLPLSLLGGAVAVRAMGGILTVASLVGLITLFGIATRNGIMLVTHYRHLAGREGAGAEEAIRRGSMERLVPVLMTALATGLALVPVALGLGEPGNEIQAPMALVILGGLLSSTAFTLVAVPALYRVFGRTPRAESQA
jgi:CzcA family heavy metal efflux pump